MDAKLRHFTSVFRQKVDQEECFCFLFFGFNLGRLKRNIETLDEAEISDAISCTRKTRVFCCDGFMI